MKKNKIDYISLIISTGIIFISSTILISALIGTIFTYFHWQWGLVSNVLILILSGAISYYLRKFEFFRIHNYKELLIYLFVLSLSVFLYIQISPVLSIQQDQSIYILRSFNLINYGYVDKPMKTFSALTNNGLIDLEKVLQGYGQLMNGNQMHGISLYPDFYAGASYFFALCGSLVRRYAFYGQTVIMLVNTSIMYFIIKNILKNRDKVVAGLYTMTFMISPVILWFGRSSSTEPMALFIWLLLFALLLSEQTKDSYLILVFTVCLIGRIDYLLVSLLGIFLLTYRNIKSGLIYSIILSAYAFIVSKTFWIYYNRISLRDFKLIKYQLILILIVFIISFIISKWGKKIIETIYNHKYTRIVFLVIGLCVVMLMFRNTFTPESMVGRFTEFGLNIRSFEEYILDNLFTVFPSIIIVLGLVGTYKVLLRKKINMLAGIYLVGLLVIYSYFVYKSGNAPQMYFLLRRYYNVFLPAVLMVFIVFIDDNDRKKQIIIALMCFLLSANLYTDTRQKIEYAGLKQAVENFITFYPEDKISTIFYNHDDKIDISPILSYTSFDMVPLLSTDELIIVSNLEEYYDPNTSIYMSKTQLEGVQYNDIKTLNYYRMGENMEEVPKEYYYLENEFYIYNMQDVIAAYVD